MAARRKKEGARKKASAGAARKKPAGAEASGSSSDSTAAEREATSEDDADLEEAESEAPSEKKSAPKAEARAVSRRRLRLFSATGVLAAALIAVTVNVLITRFYKRWDWTTEGMYTLSAATVETLHKLDRPIEVVVFLSRSDPLQVSVRQMLVSYGAETRHLKVRHVDPDSNPVEYLALQKEYSLDVREQTSGGRIAVAILRDKKRWFVGDADMVGIDSQGRTKPQLEQALTVGIRNVLEGKSTVACFTTGHGESSLDDGKAAGLGELKFRIKKDSYEPRTVDLTASKPEPLDACDMVVIAGPEEPFSAEAAARVLEFYKGGGDVLLMSNALLDDDSRIIDSGLTKLAEAGGVKLGSTLILEAAPDRMLTPLGEIFRAEPRRHTITRGLNDRGDLLPPTVAAAQSLDLLTDVNAEVILRSSDDAFGLKDVRPFIKGGELPAPGPDTLRGPFALAIATEKNPGKDGEPGTRMVVVGTSNMATSENWRAAPLLPNRLFTLSALSWLAAKDSIIDVPEKRTHGAGLNLSEESRDELYRYVLAYMPLTALLMGMLVMYRRRSVERRSRRRPKDEDED